MPGQLVLLPLQLCSAAALEALADEAGGAMSVVAYEEFCDVLRLGLALYHKGDELELGEDVRKILSELIDRQDDLTAIAVVVDGVGLDLGAAAEGCLVDAARRAEAEAIVDLVEYTQQIWAKFCEFYESQISFKYI